MLKNRIKQLKNRRRITIRIQKITVSQTKRITFSTFYVKVSLNDIRRF